MRRKAHIIVILALGVAATAGRVSPVVGRLVSSAQNLPHYIRDSRTAGGSLSPIERFVFSLVLTETTPRACNNNSGAVPPEHRT